jgi:hypothetical protein
MRAGLAVSIRRNTRAMAWSPGLLGTNLVYQEPIRHEGGGRDGYGGEPGEPMRSVPPLAPSNERASRRRSSQRAPCHLFVRILWRDTRGIRECPTARSLCPHPRLGFRRRTWCVAACGEGPATAHSSCRGTGNDCDPNPATPCNDRFDPRLSGARHGSRRPPGGGRPSPISRCVGTDSYSRGGPPCGTVAVGTGGLRSLDGGSLARHRPTARTRPVCRVACLV